MRVRLASDQVANQQLEYDGNCVRLLSGHVDQSVGNCNQRHLSGSARFFVHQDFKAEFHKLLENHSPLEVPDNEKFY